MSEPSQLYARVRLPRATFEALLARPFPDPSDDPAVLAWLGDAKFYGDPYTPERIRTDVVAHQSTVGAWVASLGQAGPWGIPVPSRNAYDDAGGTWTLAVLDFSENYDDFTAAVAVFRELGRDPDVAGGMLIFSHLFEDDTVLAALTIGAGTTTFLNEREASGLVAEACATMDELTAEGAAHAGD